MAGGCAPYNLRCCCQRLACLKELKNNYCIVLNKHESYGIIEEVDHIAESGMVYHLPHRAIVKSKKETPNIRIVFHGSSYLKNELSIEFLEPGRCLLPLLYDAFLRFRLRSKGIIDDIRQTFLFANLSRTAHCDNL